MTTCSKCGTEHSRMRTRSGKPASYCCACHAEWMRKNRPKHSDLPEESRRRSNARAYAKVYQKRGKILPEPCRKCGATPAQKHHPDYTKPTLVEWLCRRCHLNEHYSQNVSRGTSTQA